mmetsp:Transcript_48160/g.114604  ORF Transcript_48160/g.114604 Transcript_48160/m.114604 type:complete len:262 (-) Transcript_48160:513-1298(-)
MHVLAQPVHEVGEVGPDKGLASRAHAFHIHLHAHLIHMDGPRVLLMRGILLLIRRHLLGSPLLLLLLLRIILSSHLLRSLFRLLLLLPRLLGRPGGLGALLDPRLRRFVLRLRPLLRRLGINGVLLSVGSRGAHAVRTRLRRLRVLLSILGSFLVRLLGRSARLLEFLGRDARLLEIARAPIPLQRVHHILEPPHDLLLLLNLLRHGSLLLGALRARRGDPLHEPRAERRAALAVAPLRSPCCGAFLLNCRLAPFKRLLSR